MESATSSGILTSLAHSPIACVAAVDSDRRGGIGSECILFSFHLLAVEGLRSPARPLSPFNVPSPRGILGSLAKGLAL